MEADEEKDEGDEGGEGDDGDEGCHGDVGANWPVCEYAVPAGEVPVVDGPGGVSFALAFRDDLFPFQRTQHIWSRLVRTTPLIEARLRWDMFLIGLASLRQPWQPLQRFRRNHTFDRALIDVIQSFVDGVERRPICDGCD